MKTADIKKTSLTILSIMLLLSSDTIMFAKGGSGGGGGGGGGGGSSSSSSSSSVDSVQSSSNSSSDDNLPRHSGLDDNGLRGDGTVDDNSLRNSGLDDNGLRGDGTVDDNLPRHSGLDDNGLRGDGTVDDNTGALDRGRGRDDTGSGTHRRGGRGLDDNSGSLSRGEGRFHDIKDNFARDDILNLASRGIIRGFDDNSFRPNRPVTRAEFLAMAMKSMDMDVTSSTGSMNFKDVREDWMKPIIKKALELGIISGNSNRFRPNEAVNRGEAVVILLNMMNIKKDDNPKNSFDDVKDDRLVPFVEKAKELGIISGQKINGINRFRPNDAISRAEAAKVINKTLDLR